MRVLFWENNEEDRANLARALRENDHEVEATESIDEFREFLGQRRWDVVVLDLLDKKEEGQRREIIKLPETTGFSLAREVREKDSTVLIFLVTRFSRVVELGLERLGSQVFLDSKQGQFSWLASRMGQVHRLIQEKEDLGRDNEDLREELARSARQDSRESGRRNSVALLGVILFLFTLFGALVLPEDAAGTSIAKALLVFGLAACGASGATISAVFWPQRRRITTIISVGAAVGAALGLTYLLPIYEAAGTKFPGRGVLFVGSLVAFCLGVTFEIAMARVRDIGSDYVQALHKRSGQEAVRKGDHESDKHDMQ